jgi:DNA-binding protein HU-beta
MALKKTTGATTGTAKKTAAKGSTAKKAAPKKAGAAKKAPKKAAGPKLSPAQSDLLKRVATAGETGYHAEKKPENKSLESLVKHKLVKRGKKHPTTKNYHYAITKVGQKHLDQASAPPAASTAPKTS